MVTDYPACFFSEENGFSVFFPDLNIATCGDTIEDAKEMAVDCLAMYIYSSQINGTKLAPPSSLEDINPVEIAAEARRDYELEYIDAFAFMISVDVDAYARKNFGKTGHHPILFLRNALVVPIRSWLNNRWYKKVRAKKTE